MKDTSCGVARRGGFALVELAAAAGVGLVLLALIVLMSGDRRRLGRLGEDLGKLGQIGSLTAQYGADHADRFWTFSWRKGDSLSQYPDLNNAFNDLQAAANQAVDILRRRAGRTDIFQISSWIPHTLYNHLPLLDYGQKVPDELFLSAGDRHRVRWSRDPRGFDMGIYQPWPSGSSPGSNAGKRWPYSSSFAPTLSLVDKSAVSNRLSQGSTHNTTMVPGGVILGGRVLSDVAFPAHKVMMHDAHGRHFGVKQPYATHDQARLPVLLADGSVAVKAAAESNPGWRPTQPASGGSSLFLYQPDAWEPATMSGSASEQVTGRFRWTRGSATENGHVGRDFGGPETCSGQPGCP